MDRPGDDFDLFCGGGTGGRGKLGKTKQEPARRPGEQQARKPGKPGKLIAGRTIIFLKAREGGGGGLGKLLGR